MPLIEEAVHGAWGDPESNYAFDVEVVVCWYPGGNPIIILLIYYTFD